MRGWIDKKVMDPGEVGDKPQNSQVNKIGG